MEMVYSFPVRLSMHVTSLLFVHCSVSVLRLSSSLFTCLSSNNVFLLIFAVVLASIAAFWVGCFKLLMQYRTSMWFNACSPALNEVSVCVLCFSANNSSLLFLY